MRVLCLDPASNKFGIAGIEFINDENGQSLSLYVTHLLESPKKWTIDQKAVFVAHAVAMFIHIDRPDLVVSEEPFGQGWAVKRFASLVGMIKAESSLAIEWQGVGQARKAVLGEGYGAENKRKTAQWLLEYPWDISSKRLLEAELAAASTETDDGYDILDAVLHGLCFLVQNHGLQPKHKPEKVKRPKKIKNI